MKPIYQNAVYARFTMNTAASPYIVVDMELKGRIREALLKMICEFEIDEH